MKKQNKRKHTRIRFLADYIAWMNSDSLSKQEAALRRATLIERIYGASVKVRERI